MIQLKKLDKLIILISISGIILSFIFLYRKSERKVLIVYADDKETVYSLQDADFTVRSREGSLKVKIRDGKVMVIESSCPDKWCTRMGRISRPGESIVCLPSKIFLIIREAGRDKNNEIDSITR